MRLTRALVPAAVAAVALTGCTGDDTDGPTEATPTAGLLSPAPSASPGPFEGTTEQCLVGTWWLDAAGTEEPLRELLGDDGLTLAGAARWEIADGGEFRAEVDSARDLDVEVEGGALSSRTVFRGSVTGTWRLDGEQLYVEDLTTDALEAETTATLAGEPVEVPDGSADDAVEVLPPTLSDVTCDNATLTLASTIGTDEDSQPITLTYTLRR